ncbi:VWA domain-containing protein [Ileibacterium valens]|uniref:VWA domain-containing protein n=1 Tax=Ileibacterium valens TaxID=1862668 RepID=UPI0024B9CDDF|nr:VWA domain-containing protein [Ileibacterium valens]
MNTRWTRRMCSFSLSAALLSTLSLPVHGQSKATAEVIKENPAIPAVEISNATLLDKSKKPVLIGSDTQIPVQELLDQIEKGQATAVKAGVFVSDEEALNGIVQLTFQIAGKENESEKPINVMLILDQTGSMNMYCKDPTTFMMDCLNPDHLYYIPEGTFGNHGAGYVRIADFNPEGPVFKSWYGEENGNKYVVKWVVDMLNSLPKTTSDKSQTNSDSFMTDPNDENKSDFKEPENQHSLADNDQTGSEPQSGVIDEITKDQNIPSVQSSEPAPAPASENDFVMTSSNTETQPVISQSVPSTITAEDVQPAMVEKEITEYEEVEEMVEITQEPKYETVTEKQMVYPEPYTIEEPEIQMVEGEPVFDEETGEMIPGEMVEKEVLVSKTITPEPYETIVEKQVLVEQEPVYEKVIRKVPVTKTILVPAKEADTDGASAVLTPVGDSTVQTIIPNVQNKADESAALAEENNPAVFAGQEQTIDQSGTDQTVNSDLKQSSLPEGNSDLTIQEENNDTDIPSDHSSESEAIVISPSESQGELQTSIVQDETETYLAGMDTKTADNKDDEYDLETHRMDGIYAPVYDSGYNVDFFSIIKWNPNDNHYHISNGNYVKIDQPSYTSQTLNGQDLGYIYYSPAEDNQVGCVDRAILQKQYVRNFVQKVFAQNPENKVAIELFNNDDNQALRTDFTSNYADLQSALNFLQGGNNTNYDLAFKVAGDMIENSRGYMKDSALYTIFVSDGQPNRALMKQDPNMEDVYNQYGGFNEYAGYEAARHYKEKYPQTLYAAGLQTDIKDYLGKLASSPQYAVDCNTMDEFNQFLTSVQSSWQKAHPKNGVLEDIIADGFTLRIDEMHPFTLDQKNFTRPADLPENVRISGKKIQISLDVLDEKGRLVRFYVQADPELLKNDKNWVDLPTNQSATLTYEPVLIENKDLVYGKPVTVDIPTPFAKFGHSKVTALKKSNRLDETLQPGESIEYTIEVKNTGLLDLNELLLSDAIPEGLEYVSGGTLRDGKVYFTLRDLKAGSIQKVSFICKVEEDAIEQGIEKVENTGYFGIQPGDDGTPDLPTNTVENPLEPKPVPEPEPEPEPEPKPEPEPAPALKPVIEKPTVKPVVQTAAALSGMRYPMIGLFGALLLGAATFCSKQMDKKNKR